MDSALERRTFEELVADLDSCTIEDFFNQNFVDNPIGPSWDFHRNENQALRIDSVTPVALPAALSPPSDFVEHQLLPWDSFALDEVASSMVDARLPSYVEDYLARLQVAHGQQLTVDQAILILRHQLMSLNPSPYNPHFGHSASPSMPFVPPVKVAPMSPDVAVTEPSTSARVPVAVEAPALPGTENFRACDLSSLRRIFLDGERVKVECLWPKCGRTMMKDNHPRHIRECHLRAKRALRKNGVSRKS